MSWSPKGIQPHSPSHRPDHIITGLAALACALAMSPPFPRLDKSWAQGGGNLSLGLLLGQNGRRRAQGYPHQRWWHQL